MRIVIRHHRTVGTFRNDHTEQVLAHGNEYVRLSSICLIGCRSVADSIHLGIGRCGHETGRSRKSR